MIIEMDVNLRSRIFFELGFLESYIRNNHPKDLDLLNRVQGLGQIIEKEIEKQVKEKDNHFKHENTAIGGR